MLNSTKYLIWNWINNKCSSLTIRKTLMSSPPTSWELNWTQHHGWLQEGIAKADLPCHCPAFASLPQALYAFHSKPCSFEGGLMLCSQQKAPTWKLKMKTSNCQEQPQNENAIAKCTTLANTNNFKLKICWPHHHCLMPRFRGRSTNVNEAARLLSPRLLRHDDDVWV